ncbi:hypothetical protein [Paenibacillus sp. FSL L8-0463]|uniref:hypothetical protein n=1 Tax=Paenibacillus sp. FSL L8-0463 TaxID=2954687 RepID=UPI003119DC05
MYYNTNGIDMSQRFRTNIYRAAGFYAGLISQRFRFTNVSLVAYIGDREIARYNGLSIDRKEVAESLRDLVPLEYRKYTYVNRSRQLKFIIALLIIGLISGGYLSDLKDAAESIFQ